MKFGLFGGARAARGGPTGDSQGYADYIDYVSEAEALGFHGVFIVEHHFTGHGQVSASLNVLSYLAARTSRIRLGTAVVVLPWHNPVLVAEQAATLDLLSNGRFDFGVGKGYREAEFAGFCVAPDEATERFDEAMDVIRKAWSSPGRFSHHGRRWNFDNIVVEPMPKQRPHPPFWLGAGSEQSIRRAAREGYNLLLDQLGPIDLTVSRVAAFRSECARVGRAFDPLTIGVTRGLQILHHESERDAAIATRFDVLKAIGGLARGAGADIYHRIGEQGALRELDDAALLGTPDEIVARLRRLASGGVALVLLVDPRPSIETLRFFAREIMPEFAEPATAAQ
ncbi:MAG TPA: LLM class flavin-dependent oxidoreductase [Stellaceae bacterium]|jgi:alkanesulfonate monooxygenase SsuD/methylene tetrahydromethanopterin reductase-like flavin-dependent oxidoreductase (luciferase family)|nr:LLM class flavin-dependent oxidoreductase [Stellaceae bacterium]